MTSVLAWLGKHWLVVSAIVVAFVVLTLYGLWQHALAVAAGAAVVAANQRAKAAKESAERTRVEADNERKAEVKHDARVEEITHDLKVKVEEIERRPDPVPAGADPWDVLDATRRERKGAERSMSDEAQGNDHQG